MRAEAKGFTNWRFHIPAYKHKKSLMLNVQTLHVSFKVSTFPRFLHIYQHQNSMFVSG